MNPVEKVRELASLIQKIGDVRLYGQIVELQADVVKLSTLNVELEKKCTESKAELCRKKSLRHERCLYYGEGDPIPFCPLCWETPNKLAHLSGPQRW